jgi:protein-tyrosine phosphatase
VPYPLIAVQVDCRVLVRIVCTANMCRSPMAAGLLRSRLALTNEQVDVFSAGLLESGRTPPPEVVSVMGSVGVDLSGHRSQRLMAAAVDGADLLIAMQRMHAREIVVLDPTAWPQTFTLKELVRRGNDAGPRRPLQDLDSWLAGLHQGRKRAELLGDSPDDDVADPIGGPLGGYEATLRELDSLIENLVLLAWRAPAADT